MKAATLLVLLSIISPAIARAQVRVVRYGDDRLSGISEVDVLVRITADASAACGIARAPIESLASDVLRQARIKATVSEKAPSWFYSVLVSATTAAIGAQCATAVGTELVAEVEGIPEADRLAPAGTWGSLLVGRMPLLRLTDLVVAPVQGHEAAVRQAIRERVTMVAEKLRAANP